MAFKDLFFVNEEKEKQPVKKEDVNQHVTKFPSPSAVTETMTFPTKKETAKVGFPVMESSSAEVPPVPLLDVPLQCAPHMAGIMDIYEKGFANLNQPGVEFFEFFQAVVEAGMDKPDAYKMALKMLSTMEKSMSKESLISQSKFYIDELTTVHTGYNDAGLQKKGELAKQKKDEEETLAGEIDILKEQLEQIKNQISIKSSELSKIDGKYQPKIQELDCKIMANDAAKNRILGTIQKVVSGIKTNL